jgi:hypothetical protein
MRTDKPNGAHNGAHIGIENGVVETVMPSTRCCHVQDVLAARRDAGTQACVQHAAHNVQSQAHILTAPTNERRCLGETSGACMA